MSRTDPVTFRTTAGAPALGPVCSVRWSMEQAEYLTLHRRSLTELYMKTQVVPRHEHTLSQLQKPIVNAA